MRSKPISVAKKINAVNPRFINKKILKYKMPKIKVDQEKCIGCGLCAELCPKSFVMKGDKAKEKVSSVKSLSCEKEAADSCPVQGIIIG
jgi:ferredoxin